MHHKTYETNRFFDNWFVNIAGGINVYEGEYDHKVTLGNRLTPALDISGGKWITPAYGVRLQYAGLQAKGLTTTQSGYAKKQCRNYYKEKFGFLNIQTLCGTGRMLLPDTRNFIPYCGIWMGTFLW